MWSGRRYDFQWECDMIHVRNSLLDLHIRTEYRGVWSAISEAALRFNSDILEVRQDGTVLVNGVAPAGPPFSLDGTYNVIIGPFTGTGTRVVTVVLAGGQYIEFRTTDYHINLYIDANGADFCDSEGMGGNWQIDGFIGRDGVTPVTFGPLSAGYNKVDYGIEWEVDATLGDPILFSTSTTKSCGDEPVCDPDLPFFPGEGFLCDASNKEPDQDELALAAEFCETLVTDPGDLENCAFDVVMEGEEWVKLYTPYLDVYEPTKRCIPGTLPELPDTDGPESDQRIIGRPLTCADLGGECVFRCDPNISDCIEGDDLCVPQLIAIGDRRFLEENEPVFVEGCSCAIPKATSSPPSGSPTGCPVTDGIPAIAGYLPRTDATECVSVPFQAESLFPFRFDRFGTNILTMSVCFSTTVGVGFDPGGIRRHHRG